MANSTYLVTNNPLESKLFTEGFKNDKTPLDDHNLNTLIDGITYVEANSTAKDDVLRAAVNNDLAKKVDKEEGKGLSHNDFTDTEKSKLKGISDGADVSVQSNWDTKTETAKSFIKNKPTRLSQFTNDVNFVTEETLEDTVFGTSLILVIDGGSAQDVIDGKW